jgi:bacterioferritin-associated ferredoxin
MYVCLCHGVTDSAIRDAVDSGARTFKRLSLMTGCGSQCGRCAPQAKALLEERLNSPEHQKTSDLLKVVSAA